MSASHFRLGCALFAVALSSAHAAHLTLRQDAGTHTISVYRDNVVEPILTQNAKPDFRPYLHPIVSPDGKSVLTEFSPGHHKHQTGIYWGLTRVNGRDYFHNPANGYWRRISSAILAEHGSTVKWSTVYHLLDEAGQPIMAETQTWTMRDSGDRYLLDLEWQGEGLIDLTVAKYDYGGLFVRMPWRAGMEGAVVNSNRQQNKRATGQRALWVDIGLKLEGRTDQAHIAVFDHPENSDYPLPWRVDGQMGVGPSRAISGDWKIAKGKTETIRHQLVVYTGELNDLKMTESWKAYTGQTNDNILWRLAKAEGLKATLLTPEEAVAKMTVPAGFEVKLAAAEPMITQPMAFCWDDRGRMWVAENRDYETRKTGFANHGDSRILILEDTDGDGIFDSRKVFLEGIPFPATLAIGFDGLWLGSPPNLLFVPDRDRDDRADAGIEIRLTGWGIQDRHETLNSLHWGPDGWLYGLQGFATRSIVGKPADGGKLFKKGEAFPENIAVKDGQYIDGGVWRYHPTKDRFEVVAHGFSNPWGIDFDDHGQMFITACVIPHLWHIIPGGIYHRQGGKHINPYIYDDIKTIADHRHRSAHGGARIYLADEFPSQYRDRIFMANIHEHAVLSDVLVPAGSGFIGKHGDDTLLANDAAWVGFSLEIGPDGALYVLDWHDGDICGNSLTAKDTGRIYRLAPKGLAGKTGLNLAAQSDLELVGLLQHRNDWFSRRARVLLQQRAAAGRLDPAVPARLRSLLAQSDTAAKKLRALWALHITGHLPPSDLLPLLDHPEPYLRGWAIQLLGEDNAIGTEALKKFATLAATDPSPVVRLYLAAALQRMPLSDRWPIAERLVARTEDVADHNIPKIIWSGIEPLVPADPTRALALAARSAMPQLTQWLTRRAVAAGQLDAVAATLGATYSLPVRISILEGLRDGLTGIGRNEARPPANWSAVTTPLSALTDERLRELLTQVNQLFGDASAFAAQLAQLKDRTASVGRRSEILRTFARDGYAESLPAALALLDEAPLRREAIRALAAFNDAGIAPALLQRYPSLDAADKAEVILTLSGRRSTALALFAALRDNSIPKRDVSAFDARQLSRVLGPSFVDFWGPLTAPAADKDADIAKFKRQLTDKALAAANLPNGRALFERACSACHMLYGAGGNLGPDLTGSNRANLDYILNQIVNPSEVMNEAYQLVTVATRDGRTLAGNVAAEDERQLTLRLVGQDTTIAKSDIVSREKSPVSLMPEGLLKSLSNDEVRDLIAYLRTTSQVPLPQP
jgi:putative membrane-bound dehydrogenase-like protein